MSNYGLQTISMFKLYIEDYNNANLQTITQADGDTGDSAQRVGHFFAMCALAGINDYEITSNTGLDYERCIESHTVEPGVYRRSPDATHWGFRDDNFSRDQWNALQLAFAVRKDQKRLLQSFGKLAKRFFMHQNTHTGTDGNERKIPDISHPTHFSVLIRGLGLGFPLLPLLWVLDVFFLLDLLFRGNASDYDNMLAPQLLYAATEQSTFISRLAARLYVKTNFIAALDAYHSPARNGILPMPALFWFAYKRNGYKV